MSPSTWPAFTLSPTCTFRYFNRPGAVGPILAAKRASTVPVPNMAGVIERAFTVTALTATEASGPERSTAYTNRASSAAPAPSSATMRARVDRRITARLRCRAGRWQTRVARP